jgi:dienelactone hydrolase
MDSSGPTVGSAWSLEGRPIPWLQRRPDSAANGAASAADEVQLRAVFEDELRRADRHRLDRATIAVERVNGPILIFSGESDAMWPSTALAEVAVARAREAGGRHPVEHIAYAHAGHGCVRVPGTAQPISARHPVIGKQMSLGGTRPGNAVASADAWARIIPFLHGMTAR